MDLAEIRQKTLELLGDAAEGSSTFAPNGDMTRLDSAIQWAQEQVAIRLGSTFFFEDTLPVVAQPPPVGLPLVPNAFGGISIPEDSIELVRVAIAQGPSVPPIITISPYMPAIITGFTQQFTATVTGAVDTTVTWSNDNSALGYINPSTGLYSSTVGSYQLYVVATSNADPSVTKRAFFNLVSGFYLTQNQSDGMAADLIYSISPSDYSVHLWRPANGTFPSPPNGQGYVWPSQPPGGVGADSVWAPLPNVYGATGTDFQIDVNNDGVWLSVFNDNPDKASYYALFFSPSSPVFSGWVSVNLPTSDEGWHDIVSVHTCVSKWVGRGTGGFTDKITFILYTDNIIDNNWGIHAISGPSNVIPIEYTIVEDAYYSSAPLSYVISYAESNHGVICVSEASEDALGAYLYTSIEGISTTLPVGWSPIASINGNNLPTGLDTSKPFGLVHTDSDNVLNFYSPYLWGWSIEANQPGIWPLGYGDQANEGPTTTNSTGGIGTGFFDPPILSPGSPGSPTSSNLTEFSHCIPFGFGGDCLFALSTPTMDDPSQLTAFVSSGSFYPTLSYTADPLTMNVGDSAFLSIVISLLGASNTSFLSCDYLSSDMGSSWSIVDNGYGYAVITKLDNDGNDFMVVANVVCSNPNYGGQTFEQLIIGDVYSYPGVSGDMQSDSSFGIYLSSPSYVNNSCLIIDPQTGFADSSDHPIGDITFPCIPLPINVPMLISSGRGQKLQNDDSILVWAPLS